MAGTDLADILEGCDGSLPDAVIKIGLVSDSLTRLDLLNDVMAVGDTSVYNDVRERIRIATADARKDMADLYKMANEDVLTGLYNRRYFDKAIEGEVTLDERNKSTSLIYLDIDHFKRVNDGYGHNAGDFVLEKLSDVVKKYMRASDIPCRYGGEEFAVILPETDERGAYSAAEHLREAVENENWEYKGKDLGKVTISLGVSELRKGDSVDKFVERADKALYEAKDSGRNRAVLYN